MAAKYRASVKFRSLLRKCIFEDQCLIFFLHVVFHVDTRYAIIALFCVWVCFVCPADWSDVDALCYGPLYVVFRDYCRVACFLKGADVCALYY